MTKKKKKKPHTFPEICYLLKKKDIFHQKPALAGCSVILAPDKLQHSSLQLSNPVILQGTAQSEF